MNFYLDEKSLSILQHVNPKLKHAALKAIDITPVPFQVQEGLRSEETQAEMFSIGLAKSLKNKHTIGDAIDIYCYQDNDVSYNYQHYQIVANAFELAMIDTSYLIKWKGNEGKTFADMIHFEIEENK